MIFGQLASAALLFAKLPSGTRKSLADFLLPLLEQPIIFAANFCCVTVSLGKYFQTSFSETVNVFCFNSFQAAYLVAIADPSSTAGRQGLVDQSNFAKARDAINAACEGLLNANNSQQQVSCFYFLFVLIFDTPSSLS